MIVEPSATIPTQRLIATLDKLNDYQTIWLLFHQQFFAVAGNDDGAICYVHTATDNVANISKPIYCLLPFQSIYQLLKSIPDETITISFSDSRLPTVIVETSTSVYPLDVTKYELVA